MTADDVPAADAAYRLAFGTAFKLPDPARFRGDGAVLGARRVVCPELSFVAEREGRVIGSITGMHWGSVSVLGPLTVHPDHWNGGAARALLAPFMASEFVRQARMTGLFTFPDSAKHIGLYESLGFGPRWLTAVLSNAPQRRSGVRYAAFSALDADAREAALAACREITDACYPGLDVSGEIAAVADQRLGETVLVEDRGGRIAAFAICHAGPGTEAGSGIVFVKFGAARPGDATTFDHLLDACEAFAADRGATTLRAGVNTARKIAWRLMRARGMRIDLTGLTMHRPDQTGYAAEDRLVLDDWR